VTESSAPGVGRIARVRLERQRCVGAGNCIVVAPTAFDWVETEFLKATVVEPDTVDEEALREAAAACPTGAIILDEADDPAPWVEDLRRA
jgi:ferredoxin